MRGGAVGCRRGAAAAARAGTILPARARGCGSRRWRATDGRHGRARGRRRGSSVLAVEGAAGEVLVPLPTTICRVIDPAARRIVIDPPEGLLELNAPAATPRARSTGSAGRRVVGCRWLKAVHGMADDCHALRHRHDLSGDGAGVAREGVVGRAHRARRLDVRCTTCATTRRTAIASSTTSPFGGGPGMVLKPEPFFARDGPIRASAATVVGDPAVAAGAPRSPTTRRRRGAARSISSSFAAATKGSTSASTSASRPRSCRSATTC